MPTAEHDAIAELFSQRPDLAPALLQRLGRTLPVFSTISLAPAAFSQKMAVEYRADLVLLLKQGRRRVQVVVLEVQRAIEKGKLRSWPVYQAVARARFRCDVLVLVVCLDRDVAAWARRPVRLGGGSVFKAEVLGPEQIPRVTSAREARKAPELSVLSALAHGADEGGEAVVRATLKTAAHLDEEAGRFYTDLVLARVGDVAKKILEAMMMKGYEYQSDFAKKYYGLGKAEGLAAGEAKGLAEGKAEGKAEGLAVGKAEGLAAGKAQAVLAVLGARGLTVPASVRAKVLGSTDQAKLDAWVKAAVTVAKAADLLALAPRKPRPAAPPAARKPAARKPASRPRKPAR